MLQIKAGIGICIRDDQGRFYFSRWNNFHPFLMLPLGKH